MNMMRTDVLPGLLRKLAELPETKQYDQILLAAANELERLAAQVASMAESLERWAGTRP